MRPDPDPLALAAFALYLAAMIAIGVWASRASSQGLAGFFLAGRGLGKLTVALSAVASGRSGWLLIGFSGLAFVRGASAVWATVGYVAVEYWVFGSFGRRLRRFAGARDCITVPDVLAARYGEGRGGLRALLVLLVLAFTVPYLGAQFLAGGKAFQSTFGLHELAGIALTAGIVLAYTVLGGFLAVSLTDVVQAFFMLFALIVIPTMAFLDLGGLGAVAGELRSLDPSLVDPFAIELGALVGFLGIGLGSPGQPHVIVRCMSIRDEAKLVGVARLGTLWNALMALGALCVGLAARAQFGNLGALPMGDRENVYPALAQAHLHPFVFGLVIASIFAAIMSTADSQLLVAASAVVRDGYEKLVLGRKRSEVASARPAALGDRAMVRLSRAVIVAVVVLALGIASTGGGFVFWLVLFAWGGLGAAFGPALVLGMYWRRATRAGAIAGVVAGTATLVVWSQLPELKAALYELIPAFAAGTLATVLVSLATKPPPDVERAFEEIEGRTPAPDEGAASVARGRPVTRGP